MKILLIKIFIVSIKKSITGALVIKQYVFVNE